MLYFFFKVRVNKKKIFKKFYFGKSSVKLFIRSSHRESVEEFLLLIPSLKVWLIILCHECVRAHVCVCLPAPKKESQLTF